MDLGKRLKAKRKEKNISAEYLAKELGISVSTVYRYEDSSILKIPVSTFEKMCDILETTPAQMMGNVPGKTVDIKSGNDLPVNFDNPKDAMEFQNFQEKTTKTDYRCQIITSCFIHPNLFLSVQVLH